MTHTWSEHGCPWRAGITWVGGSAQPCPLGVSRALAPLVQLRHLMQSLHHSYWPWSHCRLGFSFMAKGENDKRIEDGFKTQKSCKSRIWQPLPAVSEQGENEFCVGKIVLPWKIFCREEKYTTYTRSWAAPDPSLRQKTRSKTGGLVLNRNWRARMLEEFEAQEDCVLREPGRLL